MKEIITSAGETVAVAREPKALTLFAGATYGIPGTVVLNGRDSVRVAAELLEGAVEVDRDGTAAALEEFGAGITAANAGDRDLRFSVLERVCSLLGVEPEPIDTLEERLREMSIEARAALGLDSADSSGLIESLKAENQAVRDDFADLCQAAGLENCDVETGKKKLSALVQERDGLARTLGRFISAAGIMAGEPDDMVAELEKVLAARAPAAEEPAPEAQAAPEPTAAPPAGGSAAAPKSKATKPASPSKRGQTRKS